MTLIEEAITEWWGPRCSNYDDCCFACRAWRDYDILLSTSTYDDYEVLKR